MSKNLWRIAAAARRWRSLCSVLSAVVVAAAVLAPAPAFARQRHRHGHHHHRHHRVVHHETTAPVFEWIVLDAATGRVLGQYNADELTYPASLTKMMTLYLTFEALDKGQITLDQRFTVSAHAASMAPTKLGLTPGKTISVRDLILGIVTKSANDAAVVLAEGLGGSEHAFAKRMTATARQLGMDHTYYDNASGLPDPLQRTTARDVARLALALYHRFPDKYHYFSTREFDFHGTILHNHNHLLYWYKGADGIKTGFIDASGFNLAASAVRDGHRLIGVIMGGRSWRSRDRQMASLLDQGFAILAAGTRPATASTEMAAALKPREPETTIRRVADAALLHLAPVTRAEAAPARRRVEHHRRARRRVHRRHVYRRMARRHVARRHASHGHRKTGRKWSIQIGAFRHAAAAKHAIRHVAHLAAVRGKPPQIIAPAHSHWQRLYRARLSQFTNRKAHLACAALHRRHLACAVVRTGVIRMASD